MVTTLVIAGVVVVLVVALLLLRSWLTVPRAAEDDRFRRAATLTSDWSRDHQPAAAAAPGRDAAGPADGSGD